MINDTDKLEQEVIETDNEIVEDVEVVETENTESTNEVESVEVETPEIDEPVEEVSELDKLRAELELYKRKELNDELKTFMDDIDITKFNELPLSFEDAKIVIEFLKSYKVVDNKEESGIIADEEELTNEEVDDLDINELL